MNHRERIKTALRFERPDALPCHESPWTQTLEAWREQGLPRDVRLEDHFGFDLSFMYLDTSPRFEQKVLKREGGHITYEDRFGYTINKPEGINATLDFMDHKTKDKDAWEEVKKRFVLDPAVPARIDEASYFGHFEKYPTWDISKERYDRIHAEGRYLLFMFYGPWEATWRHRGMEKLLLDTALDPDWVADMAGTYQSLVLDVLERCLALGMKPDGLFAADDLGMNTGPLMSPESWKRIFMPSVSKLGDFARKNDLDFWLHTDGAIEPLIDLFVDCGVQVLNPLEAKAGMDVVALRKRYGKNLAFFGNIDAVKMSGPRDVLLEELERKIPLALDGGYIMHSDHSCPPDVSFDQYTWMINKAREIFHEH